MKIFIELQGYFTCKLSSTAVLREEYTIEKKCPEIIFSEIIILLSPEMWHFVILTFLTIKLYLRLNTIAVSAFALIPLPSTHYPPTT